MWHHLLGRRTIRQKKSNGLRVLLSSRQEDSTKTIAAAVLAALSGFSLCQELQEPGVAKNGLPVYRLADVETQDTGVWVVFRNGVYDVTSFISQHPGGSRKILLAKGKSIEPFWRLYAAHHHPEVYKLLEQHRIGNLHPDDVAALSKSSSCSSSGPYANEPERNPLLKVNSDTPFNAEPPAELLMSSFITPNELFFVRNHLPVPELKDIESYRLKVGGNGLKSVELSLEDLKTKFKSYDVTSTVQCAGNRRSEMSNVKQVKGLSWDKTAIGTAVWTGVRLADVLEYVGVDVDEDGQNPERQHVHFEGMDKDIVDGSGYGASIPIATATDRRKDVLLAFEMNGEPIPRDHGFPIRAIVPGTVGARNVKYLESIVVSREESSSFWQQKDYKGFPPNVDYNTIDYWTQAGPSIQELPVQSAITEPQNGSTIDFNEQVMTIKGYAWSGGGRGIIRVDVSIDGGKTWIPADLDQDGLDQKYNRAWAWTPFELLVDLSEIKTDTLDIRCKAVDSSYNSQPDSIEPIWNMRGVLNNAWHNVKVSVSK